MSICAGCGYESLDGGRFCRQCGAPLSEGVTRNFGRQASVVTPAESAPLPPTIGDTVAGDTLRYPNPIPQPSPAVYRPPEKFTRVADTGVLKSKRRILKWGGFAFALLMSCGIGAAINQESNRNRVYLSPEDRLRIERLRAEDQVRSTVTGSVRDEEERMRRELEQRLERVERAREEAQRAAERGDAAPTDAKPLDLGPFEYTGASTGQYSRIPGREVLSQRTTDSYDTVTHFYQTKMGTPFFQVNERNQRQALFQSAATPSVTVLVREARDRARHIEIVILRSPFRFGPPATELQADK